MKNDAQKNQVDRISFPKNKQKEFLEQAKNKLNINWVQFAKQIEVHPRSLNDWKREKYLMPINALSKIIDITNLKIPNNIEIKEAFWSTSKAGKIGGQKLYQKNGTVGGSSEYRKKKWREWWESEGVNKTNSIHTPKQIIKPPLSENLAEFVGIILGDGSITKRQVSITLHLKDDKEYGEFVTKLIKKLFKITVSQYSRKTHSVNIFTISRIELVKFCIENLGLKTGNKVAQQIDIPNWIKQNKKYSIACIRGLMDTDGCIFNERHTIKNKTYSYPRLSLVNYSKPIIKSGFSILNELKLSPKIRRTGKALQIEKNDDIKKYFDIIGSNNPKHNKRLKIILEKSQRN